MLYKILTLARAYLNETNKELKKTEAEIEKLGERKPESKKNHTPQWNLELLKAIEWRRFEIVCAKYFELVGYRAKLTVFGQDGGIDIELYKPDKTGHYEKRVGIVQCKSWRNVKVGVKEVREFYGIMAAERVNTGLYMTCGYFTREALQFGQGKRMMLLEGRDILKLIEKLPPEKKAILLSIATEGDYKTPTCPRCNVKMKLRTVRKGPKAGSEFWGCPNYPRCKTLFNLGESLDY